MIRVFVSILIAIITHMFVAVRRMRRIVGQAVPMRDMLVFVILNTLFSTGAGTLCWELLGLL